MKILLYVRRLGLLNGLTAAWLGTKHELVDIPERSLAGYREFDEANPGRFDVCRDANGWPVSCN